jgi:hypothetical protein
MSAGREWLFDLMPALYRLRDAQLAQPKNWAKGPLESLIMLIEEQVAVVAEDLDQLYDDQFIETCAPWVIPYIGDLIGYQSVHGVASAVANPRAEVAHTISFRRRKGTVLALEQLARDVTGWGAHAVEFFLRLADSQYMNHLRPHCFYAPDLRRWEPREYMDTAFDATAHTVDVRRIAVERGRYNIQNIGIFLWSLNAYSVTKSPVTAVANDPQCFRLSSLGRDIPLFNSPVSQGVTITAPAEPANVPDRLRRHVLCRDIQQVVDNTATAVYYGDNLSLALYRDRNHLWPASKIRVCDLSGPDGSWANLPVAAGWIAVDPHLGRIAVPAGSDTNISGSYYYGFNADMGGGEYPARSQTFAISSGKAVVEVPKQYPTVNAALNAISGDGVVEIIDSGVYREPGGLSVSVNSHGSIELRAADKCRPTLILGKEMTITGGENSSFYLNGLVVTYARPFPITPAPASPPAPAVIPPPPGPSLPAALLHAPNGGANQLGLLKLTHCTLVPGWALSPEGEAQGSYADRPALRAERSELNVVIEKSILGSLWVDGRATASLTDSIVDATDPSGVAYVSVVDASTLVPQPGGTLTLQGCTVVGKVYASMLSLVSDSILWASLSSRDVASSPPLWMAPLWCCRKQEGCVRFSYLPSDSLTPRKFECIEQSARSPQPLFVSLGYGDPGYLKLLASTDDAIRRGADDGGEMGAFHFVLAPVRETDLRVRLQEYLPVGLEFGIFYET